MPYYAKLDCKIVGCKLCITTSNTVCDQCYEEIYYYINQTDLNKTCVLCNISNGYYNALTNPLQ